jgi:hypothetical protein
VVVHVVVVHVVVVHVVVVHVVVVHVVVVHAVVAHVVVTFSLKLPLSFISSSFVYICYLFSVQNTNIHP